MRLDASQVTLGENLFLAALPKNISALLDLHPYRCCSSDGGETNSQA
jgi:hypothetical protein